MFRVRLAFALCVVSGCGLGLGGELFVPSTEPNTQQATNEAGDHAVAGQNSEGDAGTQDRVSAPLSTNALPLDSGPSDAWIRPEVGVDNDNDAFAYAEAAADADASLTNLSDALFLPDAIDELSGPIPDAADDNVSSCEQLLLCCNQIMTTGAPPPVLATCFAQLWDGGNPSACDTVFTGLSGAGFCQ